MTARRRPARGFTLVEVMVALFILAILSGMAFRGVEAIVRAKDRALAETDRTLKLNTGMSQFEYDLSQMVNTQVVEPFLFDGATLRVTRRSPEGLQLVVWTLQQRHWLRWASPPMTRVSELQEAWLRSQQWDAIAGNAISVLDNVDAFNVNAYCLAGGWGNVQSSCAGNGQGSAAPSPGTPASPPARGNGAGDPPIGVRILLTLPEGALTREKELPAL